MLRVTQVAAGLTLTATMLLAAAPAGATDVTACDPGSHPALRISGIAHRIPFGKAERFTISRTKAMKAVQYLFVDVKVPGAGKALIARRETDVDEPLYIKLKPGQKSARISIVYTETQPGSTCQRRAAKTVVGYLPASRRS